jgi:hypothetical protein
VTQPEGIYTNFIQFKYEDPDFPVEVAMRTEPVYGTDRAVYHPLRITDHLKGKRAYDQVWAIVSDSVLYVNMARYYMGHFYLKFYKLEDYTYFKGSRIVSKDDKRKRMDTVLRFGLVGLGVSDVIRNKKNGKENDFFLSMENGMVYLLNKENLLRICQNDDLRREIEEASPTHEDLNLLLAYLHRINHPNEE